MLQQARASDQWNLYQAKKIRQSNISTTSDLLRILAPNNPAAAARLAEYQQHTGKWDDDLNESDRKSCELEAEVTTAEHRASRYHSGEALLQIAVVLASVTLLTRQRVYWLLALLIGAGGLGFVAPRCSYASRAARCYDPSTIMMLKRAVVLLSVWFTGLSVFAQEFPCPKKPGLYTIVNSVWAEVPREAVPVNSYRPGFMMANITKQLAGEKAFISIHNPAKFCVSGTSSAATFSLEKAKVKSGNREFVQSGNFRVGKDNQSQALAIITDENNITHLLVNELKPGQYVIWMHGAFSEPNKNIDANPSTAAMSAAIAAAQAVSSGTQGFLFAFGID